MSYERRITFRPDRTSLSNHLDQQFEAEVLERGLTELRDYNVSSATAIPSAVGVIEDCERTLHWANSRWPQNQQYLFVGVNHAGAIVYLHHYNDYDYEVDIAAPSAGMADMLVKKFAEALPPVKFEEPTIVPVDFWAMTRTGVMQRTRRIEAPAWHEIWRNYGGRAREGLDTLMKLRPPIEAGKLLLWHGEPGTGKSYGIRALMREWKKWCQSHYIVDPEKFFGEADYMLSVILDQASEKAVDVCPEPCSEGESSPAVETYSGMPWNLLVMEDSDEFLQADAKERKGQSLSRLLNMADGLIGQGLQLMVLITTNEPVSKIHPAIQREGRCLANVEFGRLDAMEAQEWATANHVSPEAVLGDKDLLLSDLYARARDQRQVKTVVEKRPVGFQR